MEKRVRSRYFVVSGGLGGIVGFILMEIALFQAGGSRVGEILRAAIGFAGFGLAVGAALGMTEGYVRKNRKRMIYGLTMGLILGVVGGFIGGAVGQTIYGLAPRTHAASSSADVAIALDSSGSMGASFFGFPLGNDPNGERKTAAKELIDHLSGQDRVAIIDFDDNAKLFFSLAPVDSSSVRDTAKQAVDQVDSSGGTNLSAGLDLAIAELSRNKMAGRRQFVIFLTDGDGYYDGAAEQRAKSAGIIIYTIGLGSEANATQLTSIAQATGGKYYPVANASQLSLLFQQIYVENTNMATSAGGAPAPGATSNQSSILFIILRILSWAVMGLAIGAGQGVRENTREDLRACSLGGFLGGAIGGALFDPVSTAVSLGAGLVGRGLADVVVGACIGGSMRLAQQRMVEMSGKETTTLISVLPQKGGLVAIPDPEPGGTMEKPAPAPVAPPRPVPPPPQAVPVPVPTAVSRPSLAAFQEKYADRSQAMAMAYRSGDFTLKEIAEHFGVQPPTVKRAAEQYAGR
ncbi:MAG TPA: vWA domain-containing protein [Thermoanaerobaculia bacterium]|jgi:hypothetical protein